MKYGLKIIFALLLVFPSSLSAQPAEGPDRPLAEAKLLYDSGKYQEAFKELAPLIRQGKEYDPKTMAEIYKYLAFCYSAYNQKDLSKKQFKNALKYDPNLVLNPVTTSPKIMEIFNEAKTEFTQEGGAAKAAPAKTAAPARAAPGKGILLGTVTDPAGKGLSAAINFEGFEDARIPAVKSDPQTGKYRVELPPDRYIIKAEAAGYELADKKIKIQAGEEATADFQLKSESPAPAKTAAPAPALIPPPVPEKTAEPAPAVIPPASSAKAAEPAASFEYPGRAGAPGDIHIGRIKIHPGLNLGYIYSDNVNQESSASKALDRHPEESIVEVTPGVELRYHTSDHLFRLGYNLSVFDFLKRKETDFKSSAMGSLELNFPVGLVVRLNDDFAQRVFPTIQQMDQSGILKYWENDGFAEIGYKMTQRWSVFGRYKNQILRFQDMALYDYDVNSGGAALFLQIMNKLSLFGEVWDGHVGYRETASQNMNANFVRGFLGLGNRYPRTKTNFTLKVGYESWAFKNSTNYPDANEVIASLQVEEKPTPYLSFSVNGSRSVVPGSIYVNNPVYVSTGGGVNLTWNAQRRLALGADFGYFFLQYLNRDNAGVKRKDELLQISPNVRVEITRWLRAQAGYTWRNRPSNVDGGDYKENRIAASINAVL